MTAPARTGIAELLAHPLALPKRPDAPRRRRHAKPKAPLLRRLGLATETQGK